MTAMLSWHLHTVPSSQVFVDDFPPGQVAHPAGNLNGHVHQVLLRNCLWEQKMTMSAVSTKIMMVAAYYFIPQSHSFPKYFEYPLTVKKKKKKSSFMTECAPCTCICYSPYRSVRYHLLLSSVRLISPTSSTQRSCS